MNNINRNHQKPVVVIIDDSQSIQRYVSHLLEEAGFRILVADNGRKGIETINSVNPDVVLLDIEMPVMTGLEVLDELGRNERLYSIILFSHLSGVNDRIKGLEKGADDYITKPIEPDELIVRVKVAARTASLKKQLVRAGETAGAALRRYRETQDRLIEEQKIASISRVASGMAHEINNPLGFIKSNLGTIIKYSSTLIESARRFTDLANAMEDKVFSKDPTIQETLSWVKKSKLEFIGMDLAPLVSETQEGVDRISSILKCLLVMDQVTFSGSEEVADINSLINDIDNLFPETLPPKVLFAASFDRAPLMTKIKAEQILIAVGNIIRNAADAVGESGKIILATSADDCWVSIEVRDNGNGIPDDLMERVFDPFFSTKDSIENVGLGLTVSQHIIRAHGGHIDIQTVREGGTCITIKLPLYSECKGEIDSACIS